MIKTTTNQQQSHRIQNWRLQIIPTLTALLLGMLFLTGCGAYGSAEEPTQFIPSPTPTEEPTATPQPPKDFDGQSALNDVAYQTDLGPRWVGSQAHREVGDWIISELEKAGWEVEVQETTYQGQPVRNIIGKWGQGKPWVVFGAHYDSRLVADKDPDPQKQAQPVMGANDGASGVAVLLEMARTIPDQMSNLQFQDNRTTAAQIWLVFFDSEDNGKIPGWDWILGSRAFVDRLKERPQAAVIIDMIGDQDLNLYFEKNSNPIINSEIWNQAAKLGYSKQFIPQQKYAILDDHTPFLEAGINAVDLIDFDYPYYHTTADTLDKVSSTSLQAIGATLIEWLKQGSGVFVTP